MQHDVVVQPTSTVRHQRYRWFRLLVLSVVGVLAFGIALPGAAQDTHEVVVEDDDFVPQTIEVTVGDTVRWTQEGSNPHSVTADGGQAEEFDSHTVCPPDCMGEGDTFEHTFTNTGEFAYHCKLHGAEGGTGMAGVVVVHAVAEEAPPEDDAQLEESESDAEVAPEQAAPEGDEALPRTGATGARVVGLVVFLVAAAVLLVVHTRAGARG